MQCNVPSFNIIFIWLKVSRKVFVPTRSEGAPTTCEWYFASALTQITEGNDQINNSIDFYLSIYSIERHYIDALFFNIYPTQHNISPHILYLSPRLRSQQQPAAASSRSEDGVKIPVVSGKMSLDNDSLYFTQF